MVIIIIIVIIKARTELETTKKEVLPYGALYIHTQAYAHMKTLTTSNTA